ncbi:MAG: cytochrome c [Bacteroidetes bacterium]|nr:cytochrome c [Bacteroidota bacterium]MDA1120361.1 cytochrome c [Bacteroidota bacterium]
MKRTISRFLLSLSAFAFVAYGLSSCAAKGDYTGTEYAPQMYHSVPYEGLSQIQDKEAGNFITSIDGPGEFYTSNPNNPNEMNMRAPVPNTVPRNKNGYTPYRLATEDLETAAGNINPLPTDNPQIIVDGKLLFDRFCEHCHGPKGLGDGLVADKYPGVANLTGLAYQDITEGHIFHVITMGKGLMGAHGSQLSPEERWKIARYINEVIQK